MATQAQIDALMASAQQIKAGVDKLSTPSSTTAAPVAEDPFFTELKSQMTQQSGIISSSEKDVLGLIKKAQEETKSGAASSAAAIESVYEREKGYTTEANQRTLTTAQEAQRGFATNNALLKQIVDSGEKSLKDLEQRKQELILQGNAAASQQIAALQVQEATTMLQNRQQVFQNMISMAGVGMQAGSLQLQKQQLNQSAYQFDRTMASKAGEIALQYGVTMNAGDSLEDVINKAYPRADEMARLALDDARTAIQLRKAQTALTNAQAAAQTASTPTKEDVDALSAMITNYGADSPLGKAAIDALSKSNQLGSLSTALQESVKPKVQPVSVLNQKATMLFASGQDFANAKLAIEQDSSIANKEKAIEILRLRYSRPELPSDVGLFVKSFVENSAALTGYTWANPAGRGTAQPVF